MKVKRKSIQRLRDVPHFQHQMTAHCGRSPHRWPAQSRIETVLGFCVPCESVVLFPGRDVAIYLPMLTTRTWLCRRIHWALSSGQAWQQKGSGHTRLHQRHSNTKYYSRTHLKDLGYNSLLTKYFLRKQNQITEMIQIYRLTKTSDINS